MFAKLSATLLLSMVLQLSASASERWYSAEQVASGSALFKQHCAACHGINAEGTANWKQTDANGNYPPPPLNGTAHAWHHSIEQLTRSIQQGGARLGGVMPGFSDQLDDQQVLAVIAFFQSKWPEAVYRLWQQRNMQ